MSRKTFLIVFTSAMLGAAVIAPDASLAQLPPPPLGGLPGLPGGAPPGLPGGGLAGLPSPWRSWSSGRWLSSLFWHRGRSRQPP